MEIVFLICLGMEWWHMVLKWYYYKIIMRLNFSAWQYAWQYVVLNQYNAVIVNKTEMYLNSLYLLCQAVSIAYYWVFCE